MRLLGDPSSAPPGAGRLRLAGGDPWFGTVMIRAMSAWWRADVRRVPRRLRSRALRHPRHAVHHVHVRRRRVSRRGCACAIDRGCNGWYLAIALGVQTKGPIALVLCGLTMLLLMALSADLRRRLLALHWALGLVLIVAVSAPWFVYMYVRFKDGFVNGYVLDENFRLFAGSRFGNQPGFWFYFQILATALLPWTGLLLGRLIDDLRALMRGERVDAVETVLWGWALAVVGFFTFSTFKLDHYVFPAAPALCLLCARAWADVRTVTPSASIALRTTSATSASSFSRRRGAVWTTVTRTPRRAKACPSSTPMAPPPRMIIPSGRARSPSKIVPFV